jgi:hypothetical protein
MSKIILAFSGMSNRSDQSDPSNRSSRFSAFTLTNPRRKTKQKTSQLTGSLLECDRDFENHFKMAQS